jgi:hypothetical protein
MDKKKDSKELVVGNQNQFANFLPSPKSVEEAKELCAWLSQHAHEMLPKDYKGKPGNIMIAAQMGSELGLPFLSSLQSIAVINGRGALWGDAMLGLVKIDTSYEYLKEYIDESDPDNPVAVCKGKKRGEDEVVHTFSKKDAVVAGLWGKVYKSGEKSPWAKYPKRMLQMRPRSWVLRDVWPHLLKGLKSVEEMRDIDVEVTDVTDPGSLSTKSKIAAKAAETSPAPPATEPSPPEEPDVNTPNSSGKDYMDIQEVIVAFRSAADIPTITDMHGLVEKVEPAFHQEAKRAFNQAIENLEEEKSSSTPPLEKPEQKDDALMRKLRAICVSISKAEKVVIAKELFNDDKKTKLRVGELDQEQLLRLKEILVSRGLFQEDE